ncbi:hypothetical protein EJD97_013323 [Solanum chilense]|uniref:Uncharacterized protein n=1 Tax=Solanum chilense TaxID=4083 RepID=A0A6N2BGQ4_SOLCI|nr:hypothetical protein EJD97_013323 [Solanum chilense]
MLVTVRRWQRSAAAKGRWGSLTKCGVTKILTVHRAYDDPRRTVVSVMVCRFQRSTTAEGRMGSLSVGLRSPRWSVESMTVRPADRLVCDDRSYLPLRVIKRAEVWDDEVHDDPSWP